MASSARKIVSFLFLFVVCSAAVSSSVEIEAKLFVFVNTDKTVYRSQELIEVEIFTMLGNTLVPAQIASATLSNTTGSGSFVQANLFSTMQSIAPGAFIAQGVALESGFYTVDVAAIFFPGNNASPIQGFGSASFRVENPPVIPDLLVDIEFEDLPALPTVCDEIKVSLSVNQIAFVRFFQLMSDGWFRDILIPGWLRPGSRLIRFEPEKFQSGEILFKVLAKNQFGIEATDTLSFTLKKDECETE